MSSFVKLVTIDSAQRTSGTPYRFTISLKPPLPTIKKVRLLSAAIPVTQFTVTQANNRIYFSNGSSDFFAPVAPGVYNTSNLPAAIQTAFTQATLANSPGPITSFTVTASIDTTNMIVTISPATSLSLKFGTYKSFSMASYLGYASADTAASLSLVATQAYNLSVPPSLYINVFELPTLVRTAGQTIVPAGQTPQTVYGTFPVTLTTDSGGISFHFAETNYTAEALTSISYLPQLNINLVDPRTGLDFEVRSDWIMTWLIDYEGEQTIM